MLFVKIGGGNQINIDAVSADVATLLAKGEQVVIAHGASATRNELASQLGVPTKTITSPSGVSSVYTDDKAIEVFLMAYAGLVNKKIVASLQKHGVNAVGLSGIDGRLWEAKRKEVVYSVEGGKTKMIKDNLTGKVERVNTGLVQLLIDNGYTPVICPPALSFEREIVNTDNDFATAVLAEALGIRDMVILFEAAGMLKDVNDPESVVHEIKKEALEEYLPYAMGRMKKKLLGTQNAFARGIQTIYWGDGRIAEPILSALAGNGTVIK